MKKIKMLSLFSGIGAFEKGFERAGYKVEVKKYCEVDKYASRAYGLIHNIPEEKNLGDITKVDIKKLPKVDIVTYGFPCVPKGHLIKTDVGYKEIENIRVGDYVLTHTNSYKKVLKIMERESDHIYIIKGVGCYNLELTEEHPLYVYDGDKFVWKKAKNITVDDRLVYNVNQKAEAKDITDNELWLMGRYFADGYKENHFLHRMIFCIGKKKAKEFEKHLGNISHTIYHSERSCIEYKITDPHFETICEGFPTGSKEKEIPQWIIDLPIPQLKVFFEGYFSGDGHSRKDRNMGMYSTVSKKMCLNLQDIVMKVYGIVPTISIRYDNRKETFCDCYQCQFTTTAKEQTQIDDKIAVKIKSIERIEKPIKVYNFEVESDNSYTVSNVIVHNCQDISVAGKQKGFEKDGQFTRSGLFFYASDIIKAVQPKIAICENVKALTSKKFTKEFGIVLSTLEEAGYRNYWKVLNAKDYGIPQNRERVFVVSVRKDIVGDFDFPEPVELKLRLKDMLESEVAEKYYLSNRMVDYLTSTTSWQGSKKAVINKEIASTINTNEGSRRCDSSNYRSDDLPENYDLKVSNIEELDPTKNQVLAPNNFKHKAGDGTGTRKRTIKDIVPALQANPGTTQQSCVTEPNRIGGIFDTEKSRHQAGSIWNKECCGPTIDTMQGGYRQPLIIEDDKDETDKPVLVGGIGEKNFGKQYRQGNRVYSAEGVAMALNAQPVGNAGGNSYLYQVEEIAEPKNVEPVCLNSKGGRNGVEGLQPSLQDRVYDSNGIAVAVTTSFQPNYTEPCIVASRGRNPENPSDRTKGTPLKQRLEPRTDGITNTITTVQKDNYVAEPQAGAFRPKDRDYNKHGKKRELQLEIMGEGVAPAITTGVSNEKGLVIEPKITIVGRTGKHQRDGILSTEGISDCLTATDYKQPKQILEPTERFYQQALETLNGNECEEGDTIDAFNKKVNKSGCCPTITTRPEGFKTAILPVEIIREEPLEREGWHRNAKEVLSTEGICRTLSTQSNNLCTKIKEQPSFRIRKLTPKECWRLMGFKDSDIDICIENGISNTQLYKMAGNSIVVDVIEALTKKMKKLL